MTTLADRPAPGASAATAAAETARTAEPRRERPARPARRLVSLDAVRGLAVVGMLLVNNSPLPDATPDQLRHAGWEGFTAADLVFPLFLFATGAAMPFSSKAQQPRSALRRTLLLFLLGVLLITAKYGMPGPSGVLQHIAIAYLGCWLVTRMPERWQVPTLAAGMLAWWAAFAWLPVPGADPGSYVEGHTFADWLDTMTYGHFSDEGWRVALSSVPSVYAGVLAGRVFRADERRRVTAARLLGYAGIAGGLGLLWSLAVPVSKPLWSPPFTLIAAGLCFLLMAVGYVLVDHFHLTRPAQPLVVLGANPIVAYVGLSLLVTVPMRHWRHEITAPLARIGGDRFATLTVAVFSCLLAWAICSWLYRRKIFVKV